MHKMNIIIKIYRLIVKNKEQTSGDSSLSRQIRRTKFVRDKDKKILDHLKPYYKYGDLLKVTGR